MSLNFLIFIRCIIIRNTTYIKNKFISRMYVFYSKIIVILHIFIFIYNIIRFTIFYIFFYPNWYSYSNIIFKKFIKIYFIFPNISIYYIFIILNIPLQYIDCNTLLGIQKFNKRLKRETKIYDSTVHL